MELSEIVLNVLFYVFAAGAAGGALSVAASRNIVRSAFSLLAVLLSAAALYGIMRADFIAAAQMLIYVGGILVLIVFAVMLTHRIASVKLSNESTPSAAAFFGCLCLLFSLVTVVLSTTEWSREGESVIVGKSGAELVVSAYQADGRTGIPNGGATHEDRVVLEIRARRVPEKARAVEVRVGTAEASELLEAGGTTRVTLKDIPEGPMRCRVRLSGAKEPVTEWIDTGIDFEVYRGMTKRVARGLMKPYLFAFEVVSLLLLVALVGAAFLARKEMRES